MSPIGLSVYRMDARARVFVGAIMWCRTCHGVVLAGQPTDLAHEHHDGVEQLVRHFRLATDREASERPAINA